ncbi:MAG: Uma2 family endonuclease [Pirellulales bacterium]|nr:Uma2 family endonuclease [Pirellulales bacterium]
MTLNNWPDDLPPPFPIERLTVEEYQRIVASGSLKPERRVEFLEDVIVRKARTSLRHDAAVEKLLESLRPLLPQGWSALPNGEVVMQDSQPIPDVVVVSDILNDRPLALPRAAETSLVVEVADGSLPFDRRSKARIYARAAIPYYWILNLLDGQMEVFSNPSGPVPMPGFHEQRIYRREDKVSVVIGLDDFGAIRVADLLP